MKEAAICRCKRMNDRIGVNGGNLDVRPQETNARGFTGLWHRDGIEYLTSRFETFSRWTSTLRYLHQVSSNLK